MNKQEKIVTLYEIETEKIREILGLQENEVISYVTKGNIYKLGSIEPVTLVFETEKPKQ